MSENLRHWDVLSKTDPAHTKPFDRGRFKGTATKPIWNEWLMTEHFGPCGIGWGMDKPEFTLVPADSELAVFCTVSLWYRDGESTGTVYGVGGDKVLRSERSGLFVSDESYKGAFTDALGNAMKRLGVNADIHMGLFDDSKYVREVKALYDKEQANVELPPTKQKERLYAPSLDGPFTTERPAAKLPPAYPSREPADAKSVADLAKRVVENAKARQGPAPAVPHKDHPKRQQALDAWTRISKALKEAQTVPLIGEILKINEADMELIREVHPPTYDTLNNIAEDRRNAIIDLIGAA